MSNSPQRVDCSLEIDEVVLRWDATGVRQALGPRQETWVQALESGQYRQHTSCLSLVQGKVVAYCCLGVACRIISEPKTSPHFWRPGDADMPVDVADHYGFYDQCGTFRHEKLRMTAQTRDYQPGSLQDINDFGGTFRLIAALARADPAMLFKYVA